MNARQQRILEQLERDREVYVHSLVEQLRVSPATVRRDLEALERQGALTRIHGGALLTRAAVVEFAFLDRAQERTAEKQAIAREVARHVQPGMTLVIDTGTTTLEVARALAGVPRLRILTSSLAIASALHARDNLNLVLLGGTVRRHSLDLSGPLTEENLGQFRTDMAILGADAADEQGLYTSDLAIARISRGMIACARERWLVADSSKFSRRSFTKFAEWAEITHLVTDQGLARKDREWVEAVVPHLHLIAPQGSRRDRAAASRPPGPRQPANLE